MNTSMETLALLDFLIPDYVRSITYVPWVFSLLGSAREFVSIVTILS